MEIVSWIGMGLLIIILGCLIAFKQMIGLFHFYHYRKVAEEDIPALCMGVGMSNVVIGFGIIFYILVDTYTTLSIATFGMVLVVLGIVAQLLLIIKYNHGLF